MTSGKNKLNIQKKKKKHSTTHRARKIIANVSVPDSPLHLQILFAHSLTGQNFSLVLKVRLIHPYAPPLEKMWKWFTKRSWKWNCLKTPDNLTLRNIKQHSVELQVFLCPAPKMEINTGFAIKTFHTPSVGSDPALQTTNPISWTFSLSNYFCQHSVLSLFERKWSIEPLQILDIWSFHFGFQSK